MVYIFGMILCAVSAILLLYIDIGYTILFIAFAVLMLILVIVEARKPKNLIQYDDNFLYLNYRDKSVEINLDVIVHATPKRTRARNVTYTFGKVIIYTKNGLYKIGTVSECEEVCFRIMRLVNERKQEN